MINIKEKTLANVKVEKILIFLGLSSVAIFAPFFVHNQWITGPIVNAILILTLFLVDRRSAFVVATVPSVIALSRGLLPAVLAPTVPFIMISNIIFIIVIDFVYARLKNDYYAYWSGAFLASLIKFLFLTWSTNIIANLLLNDFFIQKIIIMMSWPQFATAMIGSLIAWFVLKKLKRI